MLFFCYRQIFIRRPFRLGRVCAFFCDGLLVTRDNVLRFCGLRFLIFSCRALSFCYLPEPVEGSQSYSAVAILNVLEESTFFFLGLRSFTPFRKTIWVAS